MAQLHRADEARRGIVKSGANPTKTNAGVNRAGAIGRWGGRAVIVAGVAVSAHNVMTADNRPRALAQESAGWLGAIGGAKGGAALGAYIGTFFGPIGTGAGALIGGVVGGIAGGMAGHKAGGALFDFIHH